MRIATWNVNSIRARSESVVAWMTEQDIDVVALQEIKCHNDAFPLMSFLASGYDVAHVGQGAYNGVAIASRVGLEDVEIGFEGMPTFPVDGQEVAEARAISARCAGIRLWSLYVPNGRALDDPHYAYKLRWLDALRDITALGLAHDPAAQLMLAGDWNVAQRDEDVWDLSFFENRPHVSEPERSAIRRFLRTDGAGPGLTDSALPYAPGYTYWDYTQLRFPRDEGMRIDYALCSPALDTRVTGAFVDRDARKAKGASDHAPVVFEIAD
ncbi:exodeoxyribonuclease III [Gordonia sp. ABSL1-1]|uniref:exodeoxyribonuclease III n=1 Tax=Gordonia sp. ABSL1-1 TaxID=3053923 RepID=UPI00257370BF|nr:exodeoxyribonuclease III [Gordonia sp. ABSL1-1]MDL9937003.1 exodeoxyribonuclease III [Gordonia sp. ABSL1-1]